MTDPSPMYMSALMMNPNVIKIASALSDNALYSPRSKNRIEQECTQMQRMTLKLW